MSVAVWHMNSAVQPLAFTVSALIWVTLITNVAPPIGKIGPTAPNGAAGGPQVLQHHEPLHTPRAQLRVGVPGVTRIRIGLDCAEVSSTPQLAEPHGSRRRIVLEPVIASDRRADPPSGSWSGSSQAGYQPGDLELHSYLNASINPSLWRDLPASLQMCEGLTWVGCCPEHHAGNRTFNRSERLDFGGKPMTAVGATQPSVAAGADRPRADVSKAR